MRGHNLHVIEVVAPHAAEHGYALQQPTAQHELYEEVAGRGDEQEGVDAIEQTAVARQERPRVLSQQ